MEDVLQYTPYLVIDDINRIFYALVFDAEIKMVTFSIDDSKMPSLNGFFRAFYHKQWRLIVFELYGAIKSIYLFILPMVICLKT